MIQKLKSIRISFTNGNIKTFSSSINDNLTLYPDKHAYQVSYITSDKGLVTFTYPLSSVLCIREVYSV